MYQTGNAICDAFANFFPVIALPLFFSFIIGAFVWSLGLFSFVGDYDEESRGKAKALILWCIIVFIVFVIVWALISWLFGSSFFTGLCRGFIGL